jgi:hypothetical protein
MEHGQRAVGAPNGRSLIDRITSSSRRRGLRSSAVSAAELRRHARPPLVNPTVRTIGSTAVVTSASAADASRHESGRPEIVHAMEPETSKASRVRLPAGSTAPNAA